MRQKYDLRLRNIDHDQEIRTNTKVDVEWHGASLVAHTTPVREDLGLNCTQTQMAFLNTLISLLSDNGLKNKFINL